MPAAHDLGLGHADDRRDDADVASRAASPGGSPPRTRGRTRAGSRDSPRSPPRPRPRRSARAPSTSRPGGGGGQQVRVAERHVGGGTRSRPPARPRARACARSVRLLPPMACERREVHDQAGSAREVVGQRLEAGQLLAPRCAGRSSRAGRPGDGRAAAMAAVTPESMPPLTQTTASGLAHTPRSTPGQRYLWSWTCRRTRQAVVEDPAAELAGIERRRGPARRAPGSASGQRALAHEVARPLVVGAVGDHELHLVLAAAAGRGCASPCGAVSPEPGAFTSRIATARGIEAVDRARGPRSRPAPRNPRSSSRRDERERGRLGERLAAGEQDAGGRGRRSISRDDVVLLAALRPRGRRTRCRTTTQRSGQPVRRTNTQGGPARVPSPWMEKKTSLTT